MDAQTTDSFPDERVQGATRCSFGGQNRALVVAWTEVALISVPQFTYPSALGNKISYTLFVICFVKC